MLFKEGGGGGGNEMGWIKLLAQKVGYLMGHWVFDTVSYNFFEKKNQMHRGLSGGAGGGWMLLELTDACFKKFSSTYNIVITNLFGT